MAVEQFANLAQDTLNGSITSSATTLIVHSATLFPTTGNFRILIDSELLLVTAVSGTTFTVTRGVEGTTAASHADAALVTHIITAAGLVAAYGPGYDTYANIPAAGRAGRIFRESDGYAEWIDNGSAWHGFCGALPIVAPPALANWTWVNQGNATLIQRGSALYEHQKNLGNTDSPAALVQTRPGGTTPWVVTALIRPQIHSEAYTSAGVLVRESSTGKLITFALAGRQTATTDPVAVAGTLIIDKWVSATSFSANYDHLLTGWWSEVYLRIIDDGTNLAFYWSLNGSDFTLVYNNTRTNYLAGGPDQVGFYINAHNAATPAYDGGLTVLSWNAVTPSSPSVTTVQKATNTGSGVTTLTATFGSNTTAGNCLLALVADDNSGATYTAPTGWLAASAHASNGAQIFYYPNCPAGIAGVTFTFSGSINPAIVMVELSGPPTNASLDGSVATSGTAVSTLTPSLTDGAQTYPTDLVFAGFTNWSGSGPTAITVGNVHGVAALDSVSTSLAGNNGIAALLAWALPVAVPGAASTASITGSIRNWAILVAALRIAA